MTNENKFINNINKIQGRIIAVIYTFEGEQAPGFKHYDVWRSCVISDWIKAIEEIGCKPYILDVRTFILKAMMDTLPHIDFVINLNAGNINLDNLGLVPSVCSFLDIPCIPCNACICSVAEDKIFSNMIAKTSNIKVPAKYPDNVDGGIIRHRSYGSSVGIRKTNANTHCNVDEISQKFIIGTDVTVPILFNPISMNLETLPAIAYIHNNGKDWFLGSNEKLAHDYEKISVIIPKEISNALVNLAKKFDISTFCRIDIRIESFDYKKSESISLDDIYFMEINPTPTIHNNINFANSIKCLSQADSHYRSYQLYKKHIIKYSITGYILMCALYAIITKHFQSLD